MTASPLAPMLHSEVRSLPLVHQGKVRDIYRIDDDHLLFVATDRLSAYDVVLPEPIPDKGRILTRLSLFWFDLLADLVPNHLADLPLAEAVPDPVERAPLDGRALVVKRLQPLPVEAIARGYLIGSGWRDYQATGRLCGQTLPPGLQQAARLPEPIYTPSTKAEAGAHDENVSFEQTLVELGAAHANAVRDLTLALYGRAAGHALQRGVIIADTKFEFGLDRDGRITLMDEVLTPDSSRFWPADRYRVGTSPESYDKQFVRDYLDTLDWDKRPPAPSLPADIIARTAERYRQAERVLTGPPIG